MQDFAGQKLAELLYFYLTLGFGVVGFIIGYIKQDFDYTLYTTSVGFVLSLIVRITAFSFFYYWGSISLLSFQHVHLHHSRLVILSRSSSSSTSTSLLSLYPPMRSLDLHSGLAMF